MANYILVVLVAVLNILSLTFFKLGVARAGGISVADLTSPMNVTVKILTTPLLLLGIGTSIGTTLLWLATLSRLPANVAAPLMNGVFYVLLIGVSVVFLGEDLSPRKVAAVAIICLGAGLLVSSPGTAVS